MFFLLFDTFFKNSNVSTTGTLALRKNIFEQKMSKATTFGAHTCTESVNLDIEHSMLSQTLELRTVN